MCDLKTLHQILTKSIEESRQKEFERPQLQLPVEDIYYEIKKVKKKVEPKRVIEIDL